jgi:hypothetical protein
MMLGRILLGRWSSFRSSDDEEAHRAVDFMSRVVPRQLPHIPAVLVSSRDTARYSDQAFNTGSIGVRDWHTPAKRVATPGAGIHSGGLGIRES